MEAIECRRAAAELRAAWVVGNEYLQRAAPWATVKTDPEAAATATRFGLNLIRLYAIVSRPFIPDASDAMLAALGLDPATATATAWPADAAAALDALAPGHAFGVPDNLFRKIEDAEREALEARFAGQG
jgi:methionyl-tRNA synthetase